MRPEDQRRWLAHVDESLERRRASIARTRHERNTAEGPRNSEGDSPKEQINTNLSIHLNAIEHDLLFRNELAQATENTRVDSGAAVGVEIAGDEPEKVLFMYNYGSLPDTQVVTPNSPLGEAISGLKAGDVTSYNINKQDIFVKITSVE